MHGGVRVVGGRAHFTRADLCRFLHEDFGLFGAAVSAERRLLVADRRLAPEAPFRGVTQGGSGGGAFDQSFL